MKIAKQSLRTAAVAAAMIGVFGLVSARAQGNNPPAGAPSTVTPQGRPNRGNKGKLPRPCKQISDACRQAGFIKGDWKKGDGLWRDCVDPIVQGATNVPGATKPLPTVDPQIVAACKTQNPKYGEGKVGSVLPAKQQQPTQQPQ